ncbi:MAG TPA: hypothetical protein VGB25_09270 [Candidatus Binatia bacterium]
MATPPEQEYLRLPGRGIRRERFFSPAATTSSLWLAEDHLLCVDNDRFGEDYRRFYYKDIQAITVRRTRRWEAWNAAWIVLAGVAAGSMALLGGPVFLWALEGAFCAGLLVNLLRGPSCICHLYTAVHTEELPSVGHLKTFRKAMDLLALRIRRVQGELVEDGLGEMAQDRALKINAGEPQGALRAGSTGGEGNYGGGAHRILFVLLLLAGGVNSVFLSNRHIAITILNIGLALGMFIAVLVAVVRQCQEEVRAGVRWLTWTTLGFLTVFYFAGIVHYMFVTIAYSRSAGSQWELMKIYAALPPADAPWLAALKIPFISGALFLGLPGLVLLMRGPGKRRGQTGLT